MTTVIAIVLIAFFAGSALATVYLIGKPREPITRSVAVVTIVLDALIILGVLALLAGAR